MISAIIGKTISELRKIKGITQENLATAVGVSPQAVSKWESGGTPDIELLPKIAEYFGVSIDSLFGRNISDYSKLEMELTKAIADVPFEQRFKKAFNYCWAIEKGIIGITDDNKTPDDIIEKDKERVYSQMVYDEGITTMSFYNDLRYFLIMPEPEIGWNKELGFKEQYAELFKFLGEKDVLKTIYLLYGRDNKPFTPKLIQKALNLNDKRTDEIMEGLLLYKLVWKSTIELDDEFKTVYNFNPNPAFIAVLAVCNELIDKPYSFYCSASCRKKPYF